MRKVVIIENDAAFAEQLRRLLASTCGETAGLKTILLLSEAEKWLAIGENLTDVDLVLTDLELGPFQVSKPADMDGRDRVLRIVRDNAPWIPVVLISVYLDGLGQNTVLADVTTADFDGILNKYYFSDLTTNEKRWSEFKLAARLRRVSSMTGRSPVELQNTLSRPLELAYGAGIAKELERYRDYPVSQLLGLIGFAADTLVLDEVVQGFSGLTVLRATAELNTGTGVQRCQWLLKLGTDLQKLHKESLRHRQMFVEGTTRGISVPLFLHSPVVWGGIGVIAYEYEIGGETLLSHACKEFDVALRELVPLLELFYRDGAVRSMIPRKLMCAASGEIFTPPEMASGEYALILRRLLDGDKLDRLDSSVEVKVGCQHGDLHTRNILRTSRGPLLIDFANYVSRSDGGVPLLDIAKLAVDCCVFAVPPWTMRGLLEPNALEQPLLRALASACLSSRAGPTSGEALLFSTACARSMAAYLSYEDVPPTKKQALEAALWG